MKRIAWLLLLLNLLRPSDPIPAPPQDHPILLDNGIIHTVTNGTLYGGDLLFDRGRIVRIELEIQPTPEMEVIDVTGKHIYPGLIAADSPLGLVEINAVRATRDFAEVGSVNPNVIANVSYNTDSELIPVTRSNGVLYVNVTPQSGLVSGQSSLMKLDAWTWEEATEASPTGLHIHWPRMTIRTEGKEKKPVEEQEKQRREAIRKLDDLFAEARAYQRLQQHASRKDQPLRDVKLESLLPYVSGEKPVFVHANEVRQIAAALDWARRQGVKMVLVGGHDAWRLADALQAADVPIIYENVLALPLRRYEDTDQAYATPGLLVRAGCTVAIAASSSPFEAAHQRNLPYHAGLAAAFGLDPEEALRSITLRPAQILGVADRLGSLEAGKLASLFIADGDILEPSSRVEAAWIEGRKLDLRDRHKLLYAKYREKYRQLGILPR
ncbi:MAG: amidohydrolase [Candidatus Neomarinimicrobiota bacterium]|nr:MAG: amidohydrolase [Candidatus Neomarinimicrobiota bacterium]